MNIFVKTFWVCNNKTELNSGGIVYLGMINRKRIAGIVLSGGKSSRMGAEKGLVQWKGKALIEYPANCLKTICNQLVISSNKECYNYLGVPVIEDEIKNCGPIGGIYSCMKNLDADIFLVLPCDVPNVPPGLFRDLLKNIGQSNAIFAIDEKGKRQPLIAAYKPVCLPIIKAELLKGNYKMMKLLNLLNSKEFEVSGKLDYYTSNLLDNVNSPDDIASL